MKNDPPQVVDNDVPRHPSQTAPYFWRISQKDLARLKELNGVIDVFDHLEADLQDRWYAGAKVEPGPLKVEPWPQPPVQLYEPNRRGVEVISSEDE